MFKIKLQLQNLSKKPMMNVHVVLSFNENLYKLKSARMPYVPLLLPTLTYKVDVDIENIDPNG